MNPKNSSPAALKMIPSQSEPLCGRFMAIDQSVRILPVLSKYNSKRHIARLDIRLPNDETNSYSWSINDHGKYDDTQTYHSSGKYGKRKFGTGDVIEMVLDFNKGEVRYIVNGDDQGVAFKDIKQVTYTAAVSTIEKGDSIEILQYSCSL